MSLLVCMAQFVKHCPSQNPLCVDRYGGTEGGHQIQDMVHIQKELPFHRSVDDVDEPVILVMLMMMLMNQ